jgi:hypothetical protein
MRISVKIAMLPRFISRLNILKQESGRAACRNYPWNRSRCPQDNVQKLWQRECIHQRKHENSRRDKRDVCCRENARNSVTSSSGPWRWIPVHAFSLIRPSPLFPVLRKKYGIYVHVESLSISNHSINNR